MLESLQSILRSWTNVLIVAGALGCPAWASALGLGEITLHSALNQPLRADIALVDAAGLGEGELTASLASPDDFSRAGVERIFFLNDLRFTPLLRGERRYIRVTSSKPVKEPFLNFLVQLDRPNGSLLREYTLLIDPPGTPGIVPAADEPPVPGPAAAPARPAPARPATARSTAAKPAAASDEQLAASILQNQQQQKTIDELQARLQAQDEELAGQRQQISELQSQLAEAAPVSVPPPAALTEPAQTPAEPPALEPTTEPTEPTEPAEPVPTAAADGINGFWVAGLVGLLGLLGLLLVLRRRQQQRADTPPLFERAPPELEDDAHTFATAAEPGHSALGTSFHNGDAPLGDVLEGVGIYLTYGRFTEAAGLLRAALLAEPARIDLGVKLLEVLGKQGDVIGFQAQEHHLQAQGVDTGTLDEIRGRYPKMATVSVPAQAAELPVPVPVPAAVPVPAPASDPVGPAVDEFELNLEALSLETSWDLTDDRDDTPSPLATDASQTLTLSGFDEPDLQWEAPLETESLDDAFLDGFADETQSLQLESPDVPEAPQHSEKLEQAQNCIDEGDLKTAITLLEELLEQGDEPLKQTARVLLAGIR